MVYIPRLSFKTGVNPSIIGQFPTNGQYTGTQKLMLTQTRIFGTKIGGNYRSGVNVFRKVRTGRNFISTTQYDLWQFSRYFPYFKDQDQIQYARAIKARQQEKKVKKQAKKKKKK